LLSMWPFLFAFEALRRTRKFALKICRRLPKMVGVPLPIIAILFIQFGSDPPYIIN
jgi:hypothetical protein